MANEEHLHILRQGADAWNRWRIEHPNIALDLTMAHLKGADLRQADLGGAAFCQADLRQADLRQADLRQADLRQADLSGAKLRIAHLDRADLRLALLNGANLNGAELSEAVLNDAELCGADLSRTNLSRARVIGANLSRVNLFGATLSGARLGQANLSEGDLSEAVLIDVDLRGADLRRTNLTKANLTKTNLCEADLRGANLGGAHVFRTSFGDVDLSAVKGLETVVHHGPSTIGIDTIFASQGRIPEVFLRGAGVPDDLITYIGSLIGRAIEYYSCFISYSSKDQGFADRLHADLQNKGVRCWFAPKDVQGGRKLHEQIDEAIRYHDKLLLVLSENSMRSEWVKTEIRRARREEVKAGRRKLFPISLAPFSTVQEWEAFDADIGKDMAVEVREYFIPDFSCWKQHDDYQQALTRLLRDLKAETPVAAAKDE